MTLKPDELFLIHAKTFETALAILKKKNADYGADEDALRNFRLVQQLGIPMEIGLLTRIADKLARIGKIVTSGKQEVMDDTVEDTIVDTINYLVILKAALQEKKN
jgi:hypothetical protein